MILDPSKNIFYLYIYLEEKGEVYNVRDFELKLEFMLKHSNIDDMQDFTDFINSLIYFLNNNYISFMQ